MKQLLVSGLIILMVILSSCSPSLRVYHDLDPAVNFQAYRTFSFSDWTEGNKKTITGMELGRIQAAVKAELEARGMSYTENGGDINVAITVFHREAQQANIYPMGPYFYGPTYARNYHYIERAISLDVFEASSKKQIWHSAVVGALERNAERRAEDFPRAAQKLFKDYPVQAQS